MFVWALTEMSLAEDTTIIRQKTVSADQVLVWADSAVDQALVQAGSAADQTGDGEQTDSPGLKEDLYPDPLAGTIADR